MSTTSSPLLADAFATTGETCVACRTAFIGCRRCWPISTSARRSTGERLVLTPHYHLVLERRSKGYCFCSDPRTARRTLSAGTRGYTTAALAVGSHP